VLGIVVSRNGRSRNGRVKNCRSRIGRSRSGTSNLSQHFSIIKAYNVLKVSFS
jgi:hypothetical protein